MNKRLIIGVFVSLMSVGLLEAEEAKLTIKPKKCVALKKGQICYQTLRFKFESSARGQFCLFARGQDSPLTCWNGQTKMEYRYRMASANDVDYHVNDANGKPVATASVNVAWVYKNSRKRNRWRLF